MDITLKKNKEWINQFYIDSILSKDNIYVLISNGFILKLFLL